MVKPICFLLLVFSPASPAIAQETGLVSILQVMDVSSGECTTVKEFPFRIEAPFWTKDGKALIYNSGGRLYRLGIGGEKRPEMIPTGFADRCNNDHVMSPDGREIGISHNTRTDGKSRIYRVPAAGGEPVPVTAEGPSYLHGWSPDGATLAYCGERGGNFDIYTISTAGGAEQRLTRASGLDDGPEYSPDGRYIWFNSVRTGAMQLWRMDTNGSHKTQMTFDRDVYSWFPHISPDGSRVVFLIYHKGDVAPDEHLADRRVALRIMPAAGGAPRTLVELFGGQGTLNVNSWSPDSRKIAFVAYRINK